eukprot:4942275-Pleurochrysis_carterae.AAC.1
MPTPHEFRVETSPTAHMHHLASIPVFCLTHLARSQSRSYLVWEGGHWGAATTQLAVQTGSLRSRGTQFPEQRPPRVARTVASQTHVDEELMVTTLLDAAQR